MPISTSSFGDERDNLYNEFQRADGYERETLTFPGLTPAQAENFLKRLGGARRRRRRIFSSGWVAVWRKSCAASRGSAGWRRFSRSKAALTSPLPPTTNYSMI